MDRIRLARFLGAGIVLFGLAFYGFGAAIKPGYSSVTQLISELNATGTPWAQELGLFGFIPMGVLFGAFLWAAGPHAKVQGASRMGWLCLWSQPLTLVAVALVPCDAGCPLEGSTTQFIHNVQSFIAYSATGLGLVLLSFSPQISRAPKYPRYFLRTSGVVFFVVFLLLLAPEAASLRGLLQRITDLFLGAALLLIAWHVVQREGDFAQVKGES